MMSKSVLLVLSLLFGCGGGEENTLPQIVEPTPPEPNQNQPISQVSDINSEPNQLIEYRVNNGDEVGITAFAEDPEDAVSYQLLNDAEGRFYIDASTGNITVRNRQLFDTRVKQEHSIIVEALSEDGSKSEESFKISVLKDFDNDYPLVSNYSVLMDWNEGLDKQLKGWQWYDDIGHGNPGWLMKTDGPLGGQESYRWGKGARSANKSDYGKENTASISVNELPPQTKSGGSLKVSETEISTDHRTSWWIWYDGKPLFERGVADERTDRMSFYLKLEGTNSLKDDGGIESLGTNFHIGTYLCWHTGEPSYGTGDGCPYEGEGNQHYYHYLGVNPGAWIHVLLDQHPQHLRGVKNQVPNNPSFISHKKNYFEHLNQFYMEVPYPQQQKISMYIDEINFFSTDNMVEIEQNDESISSLWVGYWSDKDVWEIGFHDESFASYNNDSLSTFDIRWSTAPITSANFSEANKIEALFYSGFDYTGLASKHLVRRANSWKTNVWTRFELPDDVESSYVKIFFAVRDVSSNSSHKGKKWPYNKFDGHNAPTNNLKLIDYYINKK